MAKNYCCEQAGYHPSLMAIFDRQQLSLWDFPALSLKGRVEDLTDSLEKQMPANCGVVRINVDGHAGLAVRIEGRSLVMKEWAKERTEPDDVARLTQTYQTDSRGVVVLFRKYPTRNPDQWEHAGKESALWMMREAAIDLHHKQSHYKQEGPIYLECPDCPKLTDNDISKQAAALEQIIFGTHPIVLMQGNIQQVNHGPLPHTLPSLC